jgi:hypothetical protein
MTVRCRICAMQQLRPSVLVLPQPPPKLYQLVLRLAQSVKIDDLLLVRQRKVI